MPSNKTWLIIVLSLTFLAGVAAGVWGEKVFLARAFASGQSAAARDWQSRALEKFVTRLDLAPEQSTQLQALLDAKRQSYDEIFNPIRPRLHEIRESTRSEIRKILKPGQVPEFETICQEEDERYRARSEKP